MDGVRDLGDDADQILLGIEREIVLMKLIEHPNIMRLYDVWETSTELYLILEYVEGGELFDYLCNKGKLSTSEALGYFQQIICAVNYCHRFKIAHRDLKPENLLLDKDMNIKVADFGMAAWQAYNQSGLLRTACGSPHYAAPEVIRGDAYNGSLSDIWSCGVILYALLVGKLPFDDDDLIVLLEKIKTGRYSTPSSMDPLAKDLINRMLELDVSKRIIMEEILLHPFFVSQLPKRMPEATNPDLEALARPIGGPFDIDPDLLLNLCTLWHETPKSEIVERLASDERNLEKAVYHLLVKYRKMRLETRDQQSREKRRSVRRTRKIKEQAARSQGQELETSPPIQPDSLPPRAAPPTPRKSYEKYSTTPSVDSFIHIAQFQHRCDPQGSQSSGGSADTPTKASDASPSLPPIFLGMASPRLSESLDACLVPHDTPLVHPSPVSPTSPIWTELNRAPMELGETQDTNIQEFLQQIMSHLHALDQRTRTEQDPPTDPTSDVERPVLPLQAHYAQAAATEALAAGAAEPRQLARRHFPDASKENADVLRRPSVVGRKTKASQLRVEVPPNDRKVQIVEPPNGPPSKLRKKNAARSEDGSLPTPPSSASPTRASWFTNPFKPKLATYNLLSMSDKHATFIECRRILLTMGVNVIEAFSDPVHSDFSLHCQLDEIRDPTGLAVVAKAVTFRVEMHRPTAGQKAAGYQVELAFLQEKGALSSFKLVLNRLRREWELDALDRIRAHKGVSGADKSSS
jgi:serine/threonine-protein kinase HSL1, negative regulator of Swe1 kinase